MRGHQKFDGQLQIHPPRAEAMEAVYRRQEQEREANSLKESGLCNSANYFSCSGG